ncbi:hypothetical protein AGMMS49545_02360 [Betaproteobacteria bacterium]|nr:hypothetical protein AGMMS49545_02360 [Betaproteobacteria bacterium]GHU40555.1 hypothetical protein AGMMS50289_02260 [Betaproteobacteria bacterium]
MPDLSLRASGVEVPEKWRLYAGVATEIPDLTHWWARFGDTELDALIGRGLLNAPDMRLAHARLRQARANRELAASAYYPTVGASVRASRNPGGDEGGRTLYNAGFDASWEVDIFGRTRHEVAAADADLAASGARLEAARVTLAAEIARDYVHYRGLQMRLAIATKNAQSQEDTLEITRWRAAAGLVTELDVEQARGQLAQTRATLPALENERIASLHRLDVLLGLTPGSLAPELDPPADLPQTSLQIAIGIPADTLAHRPDVRAARETLRAERERVYARGAERFPNLTLSGSFGWQALSAAALGDGDSIVRSLAATLAATLFDGGRLQSRIDLQDAVQEQAWVAYEQSLLSALMEVENALSALAAGQRRTSSYAEAVEAAQNAATLSGQMYQAGLIDFQQVLESQRALFFAEDNLIAAKSDALTALIALYKALGGGWESTTTHPSNAPNPS